MENWCKFWISNIGCRPAASTFHVQGKWVKAWPRRGDGASFGDGASSFQPIPWDREIKATRHILNLHFQIVQVELSMSTTQERLARAKDEMHQVWSSEQGENYTLHDFIRLCEEISTRKRAVKPGGKELWEDADPSWETPATWIIWAFKMEWNWSMSLDHQTLNMKGLVSLLVLWDGDTGSTTGCTAPPFWPNLVDWCSPQVAVEQRTAKAQASAEGRRCVSQRQNWGVTPLPFKMDGHVTTLNVQPDL